MAASVGSAAQIAIEQAIDNELKNYASSSDAAIQARALASLVVLLGSLDPETPTPNALRELAYSEDFFKYFSESEVDPHCRRNALALLTGLISSDEPAWQALVLQSSTLVPMLVELADRCGVDDALEVNLLAALAAVAQGGEAGAQSLINAQGLQAVLRSCAQGKAPQLQEAAADVLCACATYDTCRAPMSDLGCVKSLCALVGHENKEVRVRALMCLGMLLPNNPANQLAVATDVEAVLSIMANMQQDEDKDARVIARDLFALLAANPQAKDAVAATMRNAATAAAAAPAPKTGST